jgi:undecaprenyl-phosphate 4-deoxy-4-formamido-L-arabinose transferase
VNISIVVPCYQSAAMLPDLATRLDKVMASLTEASRIDDWELLFVVDGSPDETAEVATRLVAEHPKARGFTLRRNYGQHNALIAGIREARFDIVVTLDDDLQHPPEEIPRLIAPLDDPTVDLVYGVPEEEEHGAVRSLASRVVKRSLSAAGVSNARWVGAFRAFRVDLRDGFAQVNDPQPNLDVLLSWTTSAVVPTPVRMVKRETGTSGYSVSRLARHAMNMITGYGVVPLRLATWLGFGFGLLGVAMLAYVVISYLVGVTTVPGFTTITAVIAVFSAAQLITIGIIGEYIGRQHFRSMRKPIYLIGHRFDGEDPR